MILLRILLLATLLGIVIWAWRRLRTVDRGIGSGEFEPTVQCARCGAHIPRRLAVRSGDDSYCPKHAPDTQD